MPCGIAGSSGHSQLYMTIKGPQCCALEVSDNRQYGSNTLLTANHSIVTYIITLCIDHSYMLYLSYELLHGFLQWSIYGNINFTFHTKEVTHGKDYVKPRIS